MLAAGIQENRGAEHEQEYCANTYPLYLLVLQKMYDKELALSHATRSGFVF
jgi:hypothetical protein